MKATFVLVHGAWQGSWCFAPLSRLLQAAGHQVVLVDLPGLGLNARIPAAYRACERREQTLKIEKSPVAAVTLQQCVDVVGEALDQARRSGAKNIVLVGHSMGGVPVTAAAQAYPDRLDGLVYLAAFLPPPGMAAAACSASPKNEGALISKVALGNPADIGALRIDHRSNDAAYAHQVKMAFAADLDERTWSAVSHFMTPDMPIQPLATALTYTENAWGTLRKLYIRCTEDFAVRPALQDFFIQQADALTPDNRFEVLSLQSGHLPFLSRKVEVAEALDQFAATGCSVT